jgi:hypothetical protein
MLIKTIEALDEEYMAKVKPLLAAGKNNEAFLVKIEFWKRVNEILCNNKNI